MGTKHDNQILQMPRHKHRAYVTESGYRNTIPSLQSGEAENLIGLFWAQKNLQPPEGAQLFKVVQLHLCRFWNDSFKTSPVS